MPHRSIGYVFYDASILKAKWQCEACWNDAQVKETVSENLTGSQNCSTPEESVQGANRP